MYVIDGFSAASRSPAVRENGHRGAPCEFPAMGKSRRLIPPPPPAGLFFKPVLCACARCRLPGLLRAASVRGQYRCFCSGREHGLLAPSAVSCVALCPLLLDWPVRETDLFTSRLSICPSVRLSVCPSVHLSICPSVRLSVCPSVRLSCLVLFVHCSLICWYGSHDSSSVAPANSPSTGFTGEWFLLE